MNEVDESEFRGKKGQLTDVLRAYIIALEKQTDDENREFFEVENFVKLACPCVEL